MYKYNIHPLNWYRTAFDSFFSSAKVQHFVLPMVQVGSYWVFPSYCGIILQSLPNWTGHSLVNWTGHSVAYWIGQSVRNWIEHSVRNWIEHSVDNRIGLWVSEILHDGSHLFRSQVDLMPVRDLSSSNAFTAARGELSGKYFITKSLLFTVKNIEKFKYWNIECKTVHHQGGDRVTLYNITFSKKINSVINNNAIYVLGSFYNIKCHPVTRRQIVRRAILSLRFSARNVVEGDDQFGGRVGSQEIHPLNTKKCQVVINQLLGIF